jgi:amidase
MGVMSDTKMPVNLTFAGKAYEDNHLLRYAYAFEKGSMLRQAPRRTPLLVTDTFALDRSKKNLGLQAPELTAQARHQGRCLRVHGTCKKDELASPHIYIDGDEAKDLKFEDGNWIVESGLLSTWNGRSEEKGVPEPEKLMIVVLAVGKNGRSTGKLLFS